MSIKFVNLEQGRPTVDRAKRLFLQEIRTAKACKTPLIKLIHGYGSSGKGGSIRTQIRCELVSMKEAGSIRDFVRGEDFSPFDTASRLAIDLCPSLCRDPDYSRCNHGVTIVIL